MGSYCFGIDVGGTTVKCGLFQTDGTLVDKWEIPTRTENKGENILPDVANAINLKLEEKKIDKADVEGVGIGIPGTDQFKRRGCMCSESLLGIHSGMRRFFSDLTGLKAKAGNDANVAALGEAWKGAAAGAQNVIHGNSWNRCRRRHHHRRKNRSRSAWCRRRNRSCYMWYKMKKKHVTVEIKAAWSSMHLQQESSVWQEECWRHLRKTVL